MTRNFRKTVMATTMLAGFAIFAIDAAQAGPNGGPSLGSISGFSSMRMDFNRVGGPGRALSRNDLRVVPTDTVKPTEKPKDAKNVAKKGQGKDQDTHVARVSNPKSSGGGKGKQDVGSGPNLHIPAALAEAYRVTGGKLGDLSRFDEWAERLGLGPLTVAGLLFPTPDGSFDGPMGDIPTTDQGTSDPDEIRKRAEGPGATPRPFGDPSGKAGQDAPSNWTQSSRGSDGWLHVRHYDQRTGTVTDHGYSPTRRNSDGSVSRDVSTSVIGTGRRGSVHTSFETENRAANDPEIEGGVKGGAANYDRVRESSNRPGPRNSTGGENEDQIERQPDEETSGGENPPDSQPTEGYSARGMGRPASICGPGGCWVGDATSRRYVNPREEDGSTAPTTRRASPGWATDPNPDELGGGGGNSGRTGYTPQDEEGGDVGGSGNPALDGLIAAI